MIVANQLRKLSGRCLLICLVVLVGGCKAKPPEVAITDACVVLLKRAHQEYRSEQFEAHAEAVGRMLAFSLETPLYVYRGCQNALVRRVEEEEDARAYLSIAIDLGYRLLRAATPTSEAQYSRLRRAISSSLRSKAAASSTVFIRDSYNRGFRPYSENAGHVVARVLFSELGRSWVASGASPEDLLRLIELYRQCSQHVAREGCEELMTEVEAAFPEEGEGKSAADLSTILSNDISRGLEVCLASQKNTDLGTAVDIMDAANCTIDRIINWTSPYTTNARGTPKSGYNPKQHGPAVLRDLLEDYTEADHPDVSVDHNTCAHGQCVSERFTTFNYMHTDDPNKSTSVEVYEYTTPDGEKGTLVMTQLTTPEGTWTDTYNNGMIVESSWESPDATSGYTAYFDDTGKMIGEVIFEDHTFTVNEYGEDGNIEKTTTYEQDPETGAITCTSSQQDCEDPAQPCDPADANCDGADSGAQSDASMPDPARPGDACWAAPGTDLKVVRSLVPWIQPDPDAPVEGLDDCLQRFYTNRQHTCPPSMILCLDPPEVGKCDCKQSNPGEFRGTSACNLIDCGPNATCDPTTGACRGPENGEAYFPGSTPMPEIQLPDNLFECVPLIGGQDLASIQESTRSGPCGRER